MSAPAVRPPARDTVDILDAQDHPVPPAPSRPRRGGRITVPRRPAAILALLALAFAAARLSVRHASTGEQIVRAAPPEAVPPPPPLAPPPRVVRLPPAPAAVDDLARALDGLRQGDAAKREEAERWLIDHPESARGPVEAAASGAGGLEQASLRYVLEAIAERPGRPWLQDVPPREGLLLFLEDVDGAAAEVVAAMRRTARAEGLAAALVYGGETDVRDVVDRHGAVLGDIGVHWDRGGELARRFGALGPITLVGLRRDGRLAFVHRGKPGRTVLASRAMALARE